MDTNHSSTETPAAPAKKIPVGQRAFSPEALAAIEEAKACVVQMEEALQLISRLADRRVDAIRRAMAAGMFQADVARALGVWPTTISGLLRKS